MQVKAMRCPKSFRPEGGSVIPHGWDSQQSMRTGAVHEM